MHAKVEIIMREVAAACDISPEEIVGPRLFQELADARHMVRAITAELLGWMGCRQDRDWGVGNGTSAHSIRRVAALRETDEAFARRYMAIKQRCQLALDAAAAA